MTDSTEDLVFSATFERRPPPVPLTHPKRLEGVDSYKKRALLTLSGALGNIFIIMSRV